MQIFKYKENISYSLLENAKDKEASLEEGYGCLFIFPISFFPIVALMVMSKSYLLSFIFIFLAILSYVTMNKLEVEAKKRREKVYREKNWEKLFEVHVAQIIEERHDGYNDYYIAYSPTQQKKFEFNGYLVMMGSEEFLSLKKGDVIRYLWSKKYHQILSTQKYEEKLEDF